MDAVEFLGTNFDDAVPDIVAERLLARGEGAVFAYVVTPNADHLARLRRTRVLRRVYEDAALRLLDSRFLYLAARALGMKPPRVVTGADLVQTLLPRLRGMRVAVVGMGDAGFAALAARYPSVDFVHHAPPTGLLHDRAAFMRAVDFVVSSRARFTCFAVGSPVQEVLAHAVASRADAVGTGLCIGAALEFAAGTRLRAPFWMRAKGLEWLYRLVREPRRLAGRYLVSCPPVLMHLGMAALRQKFR